MKKDRLSFGALLCVLLLAACTTSGRTPPPPTAASTSQAALPAAPRQPVIVSPVGTEGVLPAGTGGQPWWNDTTFYEVFVRSFYDSDGDGIGDIPGLIQKLDYLNDGRAETSSDLGITGIWLMPIMASPSYHGYDVTDYYTVNPQYGSNDDFKRLMAEAHRRGIRIIIDLVLNHTSSQHPWFIESQDPASPKRDWYVWSDTEPQGRNWHPGKNGGYYYGYFWEGMPDLNYKNPAVTAEMKKIIQFWLQEMGVDGYRLDAVKYLIEDGKRIESTTATHEWFKDFRTFYKGINPQAFTVGEAWSDTGSAAKYVGDQLDTVFDFSLAEATIQSAQNGAAVNVRRAQETTVKAFPPGQFSSFLANHDQNRTRSRLLDDSQARTAASLQFGFPGVPFIYYGEEIGMQGKKPDENIRRPMQWTPEGGSTAGQPWNDYFEDYQERNVEGQSADPNSILNHYRQLIRLRNAHEALRVGDWQPVDTGNDAVYASLRSTAREHILVLIHLGSKPVDDYSLALAAGPLTQRMQPALLLGQADPLRAPEVNDAGGFAGYRPVDTLAPRSTTVIQLLP